MKVNSKTGELDYDKNKVANAIARAFAAANNVLDEAMLETLAEQVTVKLKSLGKKVLEKDEVLDSIEDALMANRFFETARVFIRYRFQHVLQKDIGSPSFIKKMFHKYIGGADWKIKENSNMGYSLQGLNNYIISEMTASFWLDYIYPKAAGASHKAGYIHIHDLGLLSVYCVGWDLKDLLVRGFGGVPGKLVSGPAKHFSTALGQIVNFFYTLQGESSGAQAFSNFDTYLAPFIRQDGLTYKQVKQELQNFIFNINVPTRVGFQSPFTNVTLDLTVPKHLADEPVIIGGQMQDSCYGDYQAELDIFNKAFFEVLLEGDSQGRIFTFPIPTVNITKDFDWGNKKLDSFWEATAKYGIPYFANYINSSMSPEDSRSMCCRLRLSLKELQSKGGGLFGANSLTGSIGVVTLNLPMLAYEANGALDKFYTGIAAQMDIGRDALESKRKILEDLTNSGLYPYAKYYLEAVKKRDGKFWANHFSTIGLVGIAEAAANLDIKYNSPEGKKFGEDVLTFMRNRLLSYQKDTGNFYNLEATPAEGASYKLALLARKKYPKIITAGTQEPYFTNSSQLPVGTTGDIFEILEHQKDMQTLYTGGTVMHLFLGERIQPNQAKTLVKKIVETYSVPYISITPTFSVCPAHGYIAGEHKTCPKCLEEKKALADKIAALKEKDK